MYIFDSPELMQLDMGTSMSLYAPPIGTAGLALFFVKGYSLVPAPPPRITAITLDVWLLPPSDRIVGDPFMTFSPLSFSTTSAATVRSCARAFTALMLRLDDTRAALDAMLLFEEHEEALGILCCWVEKLQREGERLG